jgi:hypothetical protein
LTLWKVCLSEVVLRKTLQFFAVGATLLFLPTAIKTQWNNYLPCDGQIAWAELLFSGHSPELVCAGSFTVEGWLYLNQADSPVSMLSVRGQDEALIYRLGKEIGDSFYFEVTDSHGETRRVIADEVVPIGQWIHLAGVFLQRNGDLDEMSLYLNGNRRAFSRDEIDLIAEKNAEPQQAVIRLAGEPGSEIFLGRLDEVRISSCARYTRQEIPSLDAPFSADSATIALWHFDEPFGNRTVAEASINGLALTLAKSAAIWPLALDDFVVRGYGRGTLLLSWQTKNERELYGIEVQRRNALENFESVGFLPAHGATGEKFDYSFTDRPETDGRYYYRLKMLNAAGHSRFSQEVGVDFAAPAN